MSYLNIYLNTVLNYSEEFFVIILFYSFLNLLFSILFLELLWPTHFFNQRHSSFFVRYNIKNYNAVFLKIYKWNFIKPNYFFQKNFINLS